MSPDVINVDRDENNRVAAAFDQCMDELEATGKLFEEILKAADKTVTEHSKDQTVSDVFESYSTAMNSTGHTAVSWIGNVAHVGRQLSSALRTGTELQLDRDASAGSKISSNKLLP